MDMKLIKVLTNNPCFQPLKCMYLLLISVYIIISGTFFDFGLLIKKRKEMLIGFEEIEMDIIYYNFLTFY